MLRIYSGCFFMSAIVVAGGVSKRFGQSKGLVELAGKALILHVLNELATVVRETVVVVKSEAQRKEFSNIVKQEPQILVDGADVQTPLAGALAGFDFVQNEYALLLACDTPFISSQILHFLMDLSIGKAGTIPKWPGGNLEPLHAAYQVKAAAKAARAALETGELTMRAMIQNMQNIRYISTTVLQKFDPKLMTFFNINTLNDLRRAEAIIKHQTY